MQPTRLVVLASDAESRLRCKGKPWPLVELGGISLIERAIASARHAGFDEVVVVTGHRADRIGGHVREVGRRHRVAVTVVRSQRYGGGNGLSVLAARESVGLEPFALVMANHIFSPSLLKRLKKASVEPGRVLVAVDTRLDPAAEANHSNAMKVCVTDGSILAIGEQLPTYDAFGVGAFVCGPILFDAAEMAISASDPSFTAAIQTLTNAGAAGALPIGDGDWWFEVETRRDHRNAIRHALRAAGKPLDGTIAVRLNGILSQRVIVPALLVLFARITPNQVTLIAFVVAVTASVAFAVKAPIVAGLLVTLASVLDRSDGEVARLTFRSSAYGGFLDAVLDRAADGIMFTGAAIYLATSTHLASLVGTAQVTLALAVSGAALAGHLLVSYTTAKAAVDLGHRYRGTFLGGGRGRDRRLLLVSVGALAAAIDPVALLVALAMVALLSAWIVVVRLQWSYWAAGPGAAYLGVQAVAFDFDGTVADSMSFLTDSAVALLVGELGFERHEVASQYLATAGADFATQLNELAPGHPRLAELAGRFEAERTRWMEHCETFADVIPALDRLRAAGLPVLLCSSTRAPLVREFCERHGLLQRFTSVDGWAPGRSKAVQLTAGVAGAGLAGHHVLFIGDSQRDADVARAAGTRFVGLVRAGHPNALANSGATIVGSLSQLAAGIARAMRSPVIREAHDQDPTPTPTIEPRLSEPKGG
jgi:choline kinase/phosphoglycolate phosphatase-like HAD superfamily hydrolase/phosphatidylglycerophosphate synthase